MRWKIERKFGNPFEPNLTNNESRLWALRQARYYLCKEMGLSKDEVNEMLEHEKEHLFSFRDFSSRSGKKLYLVLERNGEEIRLAVLPNSLFTRREVRKSLGAVTNLSEDDRNYGRIGVFRRR